MLIDLKILADRWLRPPFGARTSKAKEIPLTLTSIAPPTPPASRNAARLLDLALGMSLRCAGDVEEKKIAGGIAPGRPPYTVPNPALATNPRANPFIVRRPTYASKYEAAIDNASARLEDARAEAQRKMDEAARLSQVSDSRRMIGDPSDELARTIELERSIYEEADARLAVIASFGRPLAKRLALLDLLAVAEAERVTADANYSPLLDAAIRARRDDQLDEPGGIVGMGELPRRRAAINAELNARARVISCENDVATLKAQLAAWERENAKIAASLLVEP